MAGGRRIDVDAGVGSAASLRVEVDSPVGPRQMGLESPPELGRIGEVEGTGLAERAGALPQDDTHAVADGGGVGHRPIQVLEPSRIGGSDVESTVASGTGPPLADGREPRRTHDRAGLAIDPVDQSRSTRTHLVEIPVAHQADRIADRRLGKEIGGLGPRGCGDVRIRSCDTPDKGVLEDTSEVSSGATGLGAHPESVR